jgi:hypothetical protein
MIHIPSALVSEGNRYRLWAPISLPLSSATTVPSANSTQTCVGDGGNVGCSTIRAVMSIRLMSAGGRSPLCFTSSERFSTSRPAARPCELDAGGLVGKIVQAYSELDAENQYGALMIDPFDEEVSFRAERIDAYRS